MSPGCTNQACGFRDLYPQIQEKGAIVMGANADSVESHKKFMEELGKLVETAKVQSTEASNAIEGIFTANKRIRQLVEEKTPPEGTLINSYFIIMPKEIISRLY